MPKMKTKSGAKKRFMMNAGGLLKHACIGRRHKMRKRSQDMKRATRRHSAVDPSDKGFVMRHFLPYGI